MPIKQVYLENKMQLLSSTNGNLTLVSSFPYPEFKHNGKEQLIYGKGLNSHVLKSVTGVPNWISIE